MHADEQILQRVTADYFPDGYTILESSGGWHDPKQHRFVREESRQIIVCSDRVAVVLDWARALGHALKQQQLIVVEQGQVRTVATTSARRRRA